MKDITHHQRKFINKSIRVVPKEESSEENFSKEFRKEISEKQKRKQKKLLIKKEREDHAPLHQTQDERNKELKGHVRQSRWNEKVHRGPSK